jgi:hypothetical protein
MVMLTELPPRPPRHADARRKHRAIRMGLLGFSATLIPALVIAYWIDRGESATAQLTVLVLWFLSWLALVLVLFMFRCPQCGKYFHRGRGVLSAFNTRCIHCGIALRPANERVLDRPDPHTRRR